ncbi:MAG: type II toxin-antitoxin system VapC family toxin [Verrucomicrobia bacterium]|nr:type II toxin-antitoxin system VapC family toxin [Verrucomicrobiota bacterium]
MKPTLYLESTIPSYLTAWASRDLIIAGNQQVTREWWRKRKDDFAIYVSELVLLEIADGDPQAAAERLEAIKGFGILQVTKQVDEIVHDLLANKILPSKAVADAFHIALAAVHGTDYLLTWNCRHIANAEIHFHVREFLATIGWECPVICTPAELMGD